MTEFRPSPSFPRLLVGSDGEIVGPSGRQLRHFPDKRGYRRVNVYLGSKSWKQLGVHFLVCEAFHGLRPAGKQAGHRDGDPANNRAENLRWVTQRENEADKAQHGTRAWCERHGMHKLTADEVRQIRKIHAERKSGYRATAERFGVSIQQICSIANGRSWRGLS